MIDDWLADAADNHPDAPFVRFRGEVHSFGDIQDAVATRAGGLVSAGYGHGSVLALWATNSVESVVALLAILRSGAACHLVNTRLTATEASAQVADAGSVGVVGDAPDLGIHGVDLLEGPPLDATIHDPADPAMVVFTSGSSGRAKGVVLSWRNLEASAAASVAHLEHTPADRWLAVLPLFHVGGVSIVFRTLLARSEMVLHDHFEAAAVAAELHGCTLASLVPTTLAAVLDADEGPYEGVRAVLVGGSPSSQELLDRAARAGLPVLSTYGMTESGSQLATAPLGRVATRRVEALPGADIKVAADGEVLVRGPMVANRFIGSPGRAPEEWLATGDLGEIDSEGGLRITGRRSDVIISGGENIMAAEVEAAIRSVPGVTDVAVVGLPDDRWGEIVAAAVCGTVEPKGLDAAVRSRLGGFKVPRRWAVVEALPRTALGKPSVRGVKDLFGETT